MSTDIIVNHNHAKRGYAIDYKFCREFLIFSFVCLFVSKYAFPKEEKWVSNHKKFCLMSRVGVDCNAIFQFKPRNTTNIPNSLGKVKSLY